MADRDHIFILHSVLLYAFCRRLSLQHIREMNPELCKDPASDQETDDGKGPEISRPDRMFKKPFFKQKNLGNTGFPRFVKLFEYSLDYLFEND